MELVEGSWDCDFQTSVLSEAGETKQLDLPQRCEGGIQSRRWREKYLGAGRRAKEIDEMRKIQLLSFQMNTKWY